MTISIDGRTKLLDLRLSFLAIMTAPAFLSLQISASNVVLISTVVQWDYAQP